MKRIFSLIFAILLLFSLVACNVDVQPNDDVGEESQSNQASNTDTNGGSQNGDNGGSQNGGDANLKKTVIEILESAKLTFNAAGASITITANTVVAEQLAEQIVPSNVLKLNNKTYNLYLAGENAYDGFSVDSVGAVDEIEGLFLLGVINSYINMYFSAPVYITEGEYAGTMTHPGGTITYRIEAFKELDALLASAESGSRIEKKNEKGIVESYYEKDGDNYVEYNAMYIGGTPFDPTGDDDKSDNENILGYWKNVYSVDEEGALIAQLQCDMIFEEEYEDHPEASYWKHASERKERIICTDVSASYEYYYNAEDEEPEWYMTVVKDGDDFLVQGYGLTAGDGDTGSVFLELLAPAAEKDNNVFEYMDSLYAEWTENYYPNLLQQSSEGYNNMYLQARIAGDGSEGVILFFRSINQLPTDIDMPENWILKADFKADEALTSMGALWAAGGSKIMKKYQF